MTSNIRSSSSVSVFFRTSSAEEVRDIGDLDWKPFNTNGEEDITVTPAENDSTFREYKYSVKDLQEFTAFQIKIVMKSTNLAVAPTFQSLRVIAMTT